MNLVSFVLNFNHVIYIPDQDISFDKARDSSMEPASRQPTEMKVIDYSHGTGTGSSTSTSQLNTDPEDLIAFLAKKFQAQSDSTDQQSTENFQELKSKINAELEDTGEEISRHLLERILEQKGYNNKPENKDPSGSNDPSETPFGASSANPSDDTSWMGYDDAYKQYKHYKDYGDSQDNRTDYEEQNQLFDGYSYGQASGSSTQWDSASGSQTVDHTKSQIPNQWDETGGSQTLSIPSYNSSSKRPRNGPRTLDTYFNDQNDSQASQWGNFRSVAATGGVSEEAYHSADSGHQSNSQVDGGMYLNEQYGSMEDNDGQ